LEHKRHRSKDEVLIRAQSDWKTLPPNAKVPHYNMAYNLDLHKEASLPSLAILPVCLAYLGPSRGIPQTPARESISRKRKRDEGKTHEPRTWTLDGTALPEELARQLTEAHLTGRGFMAEPRNGEWMPVELSLRTFPSKYGYFKDVPTKRLHPRKKDWVWFDPCMSHEAVHVYTGRRGTLADGSCATSFARTSPLAPSPTPGGKRQSEANMQSHLFKKVNLRGTEAFSVLRMFHLTCPSREYEVKHVWRIQNEALWEAFVARVDEARLNGKAVVHPPTTPTDPCPTTGSAGQTRVLFHGASENTCRRIAHDGFESGVCFARDAETAILPFTDFSSPGTLTHMLMCRVLTGLGTLETKSCSLSLQMLSGVSLRMYDCTVNQLSNPSLYTTLDNVQAYPLFMISFCRVGQ
jgi:hypothetical protein